MPLQMQIVPIPPPSGFRARDPSAPTQALRSPFPPPPGYASRDLPFTGPGLPPSYYMGNALLEIDADPALKKDFLYFNGGSIATWIDQAMHSSAGGRFPANGSSTGSATGVLEAKPILGVENMTVVGDAGVRFGQPKTWRARMTLVNENGVLTPEYLITNPNNDAAWLRAVPGKTITDVLLNAHLQWTHAANPWTKINAFIGISIVVVGAIFAAPALAGTTVAGTAPVAGATTAGTTTAVEGDALATFTTTASTTVGAGTVSGVAAGGGGIASLIGAVESGASGAASKALADAVGAATSKPPSSTPAPGGASGSTQAPSVGPLVVTGLIAFFIAIKAGLFA